MKAKVNGFTLIELIAVIVILGIISVGMANFVGLGANLYVDAVGRDQVVSQTRYALERITREIREALPNSVRVGSSGNVQCIEFVPIVTSSTYVDVPVSPESSTNEVQLVLPPVAVVDDSDGIVNRLAVYPLSSADVYENTANTGRTFPLNEDISAGYSSAEVVLQSSVLFDADSPTGRYYIVEEAISYCADTGNGELRRYDSYWPSATQQIPAHNNGVLMAENIEAGSTPFLYSGATLVANAVVQFNFNIDRDGEVVKFYHEVHLINVP